MKDTCDKKCNTCEKHAYDKIRCQSFIDRVTKAGYVYTDKTDFNWKHLCELNKDEDEEFLDFYIKSREGGPFIGRNDNPEEVRVNFVSRVISQDK